MEPIGLLSRHGTRVSGNGKHNFTTGNRSKWKIDNSKLPIFLTDYCARLRENLDSYGCPSLDTPSEVPRSLCNIMQKNPQEMPVVFDLHLDYSEAIEHPCPTNFLYCVIMSIQQGIQDLYNLKEDNEEQEELTCIVLGWPSPIITRDTRPGHFSEDCVRYRFIFHFPICRVESNTLVKLARRVYSNLRTNNAMGMLFQTPIGDWDNILKPFINDPIPLYGSSEISEYPPSLYINTFGELADISIDSFSPEVGLDLGSLSIHDHSLAIRGTMNTGEIEDSKEDFSPEETLPIILYGCYGDRLCTIKESEFDGEGTPTQQANSVPVSFIESSDTFTEKTGEDILNELLPFVSAQRYTVRKSWLDVGKAIYTTYKGSEEGLSIWISYTEKAIENSKNNPTFLAKSNVLDICTEYYSNFGDRVHITYRTIAWYAKEDNPEQYKAWHREWSEPYMQRALTCQEDEIAKALYCDLWLTYAMPGNGSRFIYRYRNHQWMRVDGGYTIRVYITDVFKKKYEHIRANIYRNFAESRDETYRKRLEETAKKVSKLVAMLGSHSTKNKVVAEIMDRFVIEELDSTMDSDSELTGLPNGIAEADYQEKTIKVRSGKPEDYISRTTLVRLNEKFSWSHPLVVEFMDWMKKMFPDESTRIFVFKYLASLWMAGNTDKILLAFAGETGNNGKSSLSRAINKAWGGYSVKFPTTGLTRGYSDSGAANPAWARISGPRIASTDETDEGEYFRSGPAKLISGNDDYFGRKLYSDGGDLTATATVCIFMNRVTPFKGADDAIRKRFWVLPCLSQWKDDGVPETTEEQFEQRIFPNDNDFIRRVIHLSPPLLWVSFQYFPLWAKEGLKDKPREVADATNTYWNENDIYRLYTSDRIDVGEVRQTLSVIQVYEDFESWFMRYNKNLQPPDRSTVRYHLTQLWGNTHDAKWYGVKFLSGNEGPPSDDVNPQLNPAITANIKAARKKKSSSKTNPLPPPDSLKNMVTPGDKLMKKTTPSRSPPSRSTSSRSPPPVPQTNTPPRSLIETPPKSRMETSPKSERINSSNVAKTPDSFKISDKREEEIDMIKPINLGVQKDKSTLTTLM
jgi:phage/plasmid-associated DNA primase